MLSNIFTTFLMFMHTIAPVMIAIQALTVGWLLYMGKKWKKQDPERWNRKY